VYNTFGLLGFTLVHRLHPVSQFSPYINSQQCIHDKNSYRGLSLLAIGKGGLIVVEYHQEEVENNLGLKN